MPNPGIEKKSSKFRDQLATIDDDGKRLWVYAKKPKGKITNYRYLVGYGLLILLFFAVPFLRINGQPLLLLDFLDRQIVILGMRFLAPGFPPDVLGHGRTFFVFYYFVYGNVWPDLVRVDLSANSIYGIDFPENRILDRWQCRSKK